MKESVIQQDNVNLLMEATRAAQVLVPGSRIEHLLAQEPGQGSDRTAGTHKRGTERAGKRAEKWNNEE